MRKSLIILALVLLVGCNIISEPKGTRKVTAWGLWAVAFGNPIGIGYWHSEHGDNVKSEDSAKPPSPSEILNTQ